MQRWPFLVALIPMFYETFSRSSIYVLSQLCWECKLVATERLAPLCLREESIIYRMGTNFG